MSCIVTFSDSRLAAPVSVLAEAGVRLIDLVRPLAIDGRLPLYWRCGQGTCGTCVVFIQHAGSGRATVQLSGKERNVLARIGRISEAQRIEANPVDTFDLPRLACHVCLTEGEVQVTWPNDSA